MDKARVLLVEDDHAQAMATKEFLDRSGYEVVWVEDGKTAMKVAKLEPVDCILMDRILPDINGNEVCRWLKGNVDTKGIPIIMLTVKSSTADKVSGLHAGADDYLPKPYSAMELNARIYACLRNKHLQDELRKKNQELQEMLYKVETMAITDPLTDLFNRRRFETIVEQEFSRTRRYQTPLSCMMIDIDYFKRINDEFGHRTGDTVLKDISRILKECIRDVDTASRWGGEEFVVLLPQTEEKGAIKPALRIIDHVLNQSFEGVPSGRVSVSIGIASAPDPAIDSGEKLVDFSDLAMYEAKRKGRNRIESMHSDSK